MRVGEWKGLEMTNLFKMLLGDFSVSLLVKGQKSLTDSCFMLMHSVPQTDENFLGSHESCALQNCLVHLLMSASEHKSEHSLNTRCLLPDSES